MMERIPRTVVRLALIRRTSGVIAHLHRHIVSVDFAQWHTASAIVLRVTSDCLRLLSQHLVALCGDRITIRRSTTLATNSNVVGTHHDLAVVVIKVIHDGLDVGQARCRCSFLGRGVLSGVRTRWSRCPLLFERLLILSLPAYTTCSLHCNLRARGLIGLDDRDLVLLGLLYRIVKAFLGNFIEEIGRCGAHLSRIGTIIADLRLSACARVITRLRTASLSYHFGCFDVEKCQSIIVVDTYRFNRFSRHFETMIHVGLKEFLFNLDAISGHINLECWVGNSLPPRFVEQAFFLGLVDRGDFG